MAPDFAYTVHSKVIFPDALNVIVQMLVSLGATRAFVWVALFVFVIVVSGWGNRQYFADRLDPILFLV